MKRIVYLVIIGLLTVSITYPIVCASDSGIATERQTIKISISEDGLQVEENILVNNAGSENATSIKFWIQQSAEDVIIRAVESGEQLTPTVNGNIQRCNLSEYNLSIEPGQSLNIRLTYVLDTDTENFEKTISYDTTFLSVTYEGDELYRGEHLVWDSEGNSIQILLYRPAEPILSAVYIIIIFFIVVVLFTITLLLLRKQRSKAKSSIIESEELLKTKKALLLSLLKDIEKQYRAKDISDETYNKLKEEYKQQAVEAMKKLEDIKK